LVAAEKALGLVLGVEDDGAPIFAEGETGFDDDLPGDEKPDEGEDEDEGDIRDDEEHDDPRG
jgi:hypothetical protein